MRASSLVWSVPLAVLGACAPDLPDITPSDPVCGNGRVERGEVCDAGTLNSDLGCTGCCRTRCVPQACGDGVLDPGEPCDDGDPKVADGCDAQCRVEEGRECSTDSPSACHPSCPDGTPDPGEECDDHNARNDDGCDYFCAIEPGFKCDGGAPSRCYRACGDGLLDEVLGETCDDGGSEPADGCGAGCRVEPGWKCAGAVASICHPACPDGVIDADNQETCDDGGSDPGDGCSPTCRTEPGWKCLDDGTGHSRCHRACGDAQVDPGTPFFEICDDGDTDAGDGCSPLCRVETGWKCIEDQLGRSACHVACGDQVVDGGQPFFEYCDDGGNEPGDGCGPQCKGEAGWACQGEPSVCWPSCGNGLRDVGEGCDDGNTDAGDGCNGNCSWELGWLCDGAFPTTCREDCGDLRLVGREECDDSRLFNRDTDCDGCCRTDCRVQRCGDGVFDPSAGEECDDGNTDDGASADGDGCDHRCRLQGLWQCDGGTDCACPSPFLGPACDRCRAFVAGDALTDGTGESWASPRRRVQDAIDGLTAVLALLDGGSCEVWVTQGTYHVYQSAVTDTIALRPRVALFGGFAGTEATLAERDWQAHRTVLDGSKLGTPTLKVSQVVTAASHSAIDGFFLVNGAAQGSGCRAGGGGLGACGVTDVTVRRCVISACTGNTGGGLYVLDSSGVLLDRCQLFDNSATGSGGAIAVTSTDSWNAGGLTIDASLITGNTAAQGGAIYADHSYLTISHSTLAGNKAASGPGGAIHAQQMPLDNARAVYSPQLAASLVIGNVAPHGGGMYLFGGGVNDTSFALVTGSTFSKNFAADSGSGNGFGGAIYYLLHGYTGLLVNNSILWGDVGVNPGFADTDTGCAGTSSCTIDDNVNGNPELAHNFNGYPINNILTPPEVRYSDMQGNGDSQRLPLTSTINQNPQWVTPPGPTGTFTGHSYDSAARVTILTDSAKGAGVWQPDALIGSFVALTGIAAEKRVFPIVANSDTSLSVPGDLAALLGVSLTVSYSLSRFELQAGSPCRDTASASQAHARPDDVTGLPRQCAPYDGSSAGCPDMGAYEYRAP